MNKNRPFQLGIIALILIFIASCKEDEDQLMDNPNVPHKGDQVAQNDTLIFNPTGYSPLSARLVRNYTQPVQLEIWVYPNDSSSAELVKNYSELKRSFDVPILGLFPGRNNRVLIKAVDADGNLHKEENLYLLTQALPEGMPEIIIRKKLEEQMASGMNLLSYWGIRNPQMPLIFDKDGNIRWYLDYREHPVLSELSYDNGIERLENGNFYFGDISTAAIYEVDVYGKVINEWPLNGHEFHHNVEERANGNFLATSSKIGSTHLNGEAVIEDFVVEVERNSGIILREWDLKESLDQRRTAWRNFYNSTPIDWFHGNAVTESPDGNSIVTCGRTQGIVKLSHTNQVEWILSTHNEWGKNSDSVELAQFLLNPLDANDQPINDTNILYGYQNHPDFEWAWYPHAPEYLPNGDLLVFDNGDNRNYISSGGNEYSRAVIYRIDESQMTIKQIWSYGKLRGRETFGQFVSDVDYLAETGNILFSPGFGTENEGKTGGRVVEVDYDSRQVIFEAIINPPPFSFVAFHRSERLSLYPD